MKSFCIIEIYKFLHLFIGFLKTVQHIVTYPISASLLNKWINQSETSGSFNEKDNRTPEEQELIELRKRNKQLEMENDILKQAALILGRK